ncbi:ROK family protein [Candidatus Peregrinibacteria bacterium]|nr:ROK family protein [Candidatus Peregrinibacteria bacterium]MBI3817000.1 ROK family protein [Candidatus Peregrinibacteria bacterium]
MSSNSILGVDVGGTKIAIGRFDAATLAEEEFTMTHTPASEGFSRVLDEVIGLIEKMKTPQTTAMGLGFPGLIDQEKGMLLRAPNIPGSEKFPLRSELERRCSLPVQIENDANCFALAEARMGPGRGHSVCIGITLGTGVGGGIVIDGKILHGAHGYAGEIGHMLLMPGKPPYRIADARGDIEQFLSGTAMGKRCEEAKRPEDYLKGEVCSFLRPEVFREIAWMCTTLSHLLDPSIIIFGGSTGKALRPHLAAITKELETWLLPGTPAPILAISTVKNAGTVGAALRCMN